MKNTIILILLILLAVAAWWIFRNPPEISPPSPIERQAKENVKVEAEIVSQKVDDKGLQAVIIEETEHVLSKAGLANRVDSARIIDSLQRLANNRLISYTQARAQIRRLEAVMAETDTSFTYKDKWLTVDVKKPLGSRPPLLTSTYNAELNWMWYRERKHLFAPLRTYGRFSLNDPNATISGLKHIRIEPPAGRLGFSIQAIGDYSPAGDVYMGGGVTISSGRVRVQGAYLNDMMGKWRPAFRGEYTLIDW